MIEFGKVRVHLSSTFPPEGGELKDDMRENEGRMAGDKPEEEASQNGAAGSAPTKSAPGAGLLTHSGCSAEHGSGDFGSGRSFLFVHRRVSTPHKLIHPLTDRMGRQPDGGIDA